MTTFSSIYGKTFADTVKRIPLPDGLEWNAEYIDHVRATMGEIAFAQSGRSLKDLRLAIASEEPAAEKKPNDVPPNWPSEDAVRDIVNGLTPAEYAKRKGTDKPS